MVKGLNGYGLSVKMLKYKVFQNIPKKISSTLSNLRWPKGDIKGAFLIIYSNVHQYKSDVLLIALIIKQLHL